MQWCQKMCGNLQLAQTAKDFLGDTLCCLKGHCEKNQGFIVCVKRLYESSRTSLSWKINTVVSDVFVDHLRVMNRFCHSYGWPKVLNMASEYAVSLQRRRNDHPFWKRWFKGFMKRWPELYLSLVLFLPLEQSQLPEEKNRKLISLKERVRIHSSEIRLGLFVLVFFVPLDNFSLIWRRHH